MSSSAVLSLGKPWSPCPPEAVLTQVRKRPPPLFPTDRPAVRSRRATQILFSFFQIQRNFFFGFFLSRSPAQVFARMRLPSL